MPDSCMHCFMVTSEQNETEKALQLCNVTKHFLLDNLAHTSAKKEICKVMLQRNE